jgi:hypothetical protein
MESILSEVLRTSGLTGFVIAFQAWMTYYVLTSINKSIKNLTQVTSEHSTILREVIKTIENLSKK